MTLTLDLRLQPFTLGTEPALKRCTSCGQDRALEAFRRSKSGRLGTTSRCRDCLAAKDREYNASPARKAAERARTQSPEYQAKQKARDAERNQRPARRRQMNAKDRRRRAARKGATVTVFSEDELLAAWDDAGMYACYWCGEDFTELNPLHRDHVYPLSLGGLHCVTNLVPSCQRCNTSKGAKLPLDFARELHPWIP